jgi:hypothetical protein
MEHTCECGVLPDQSRGSEQEHVPSVKYSLVVTQQWTRRTAAAGVGARISTRVGHAGIGAEGWDHYQEATLYPTARRVPVQVVELNSQQTKTEN